MSAGPTLKLCVLFEHEIRAAAKALRALNDAETEEQFRARVQPAIDLALAALYHAADDEMALIVTAAPKAKPAKFAVVPPEPGK